MARKFQFSNFQEMDPMEYDGIIYNTVENFYQAMKVPRQDPNFMAIRKQIAGLHADAAKQFTKKFTPRHGWHDEIKLKAMKTGLEWKFRPGSYHRKRLDAFVGDIIEDNYWHDLFWGVCVCAKCGNKGMNMLGRMLMDIRDGYSSYNLL